MSLSTFSIKLTDEQYKNLSVKIVKLNLGPNALTSGVLPEQQGVQLSYVVNLQNVVFTVLKKPFYVSLSMIENSINKLVNT